MTLQEFRDSLSREEPPRNLNSALTALWWDAQDNWKQAHEVAAQDEGPAAAWVHAYLHRKEGSLSNADYWYRRAGRLYYRPVLNEEWLALVEGLLLAGPPSADPA